MPLSKRLPRIEGISAEADAAIDAIVTGIEQALNLTVSAPLGLKRDHTGTHLRIEGGGSKNKIAVTGVGGIGARVGSDPGSATVTIHDFDGTDLVAGVEATAYNLAATAVAGDAYIMLMEVDGYLWVVWEECPPAA